jgi:ketosteroid isomerase-like protein
MTDLQAIADRVQIEALRAEFSDAGMLSDYDRFAALFTDDGAWRMPHIGAEFAGRAEIRAAIERLRGLWEYAVQNVHPGPVRLHGDTATGRTYITELGELRDGGPLLNHGVYHDRYRRTAGGWRFAERVYEVLHVDAGPALRTAEVRA